MTALRDQISVLNRVQWVLGTLVVLVVVGFVALGYRPMQRRAVSLDTQIARCTQEVRMHRDQSAILESVRRDVKALETRLSQFKRLPEQQELPEFLREIAQAAQQAQLKRPDIRQQAIVQRSERLSEAPIQLSFEGDFTGVFSFLKEAEGLPRLTRVPAMNIKSKDKYGQVKLQMTMNLYCAAE